MGVAMLPLMVTLTHKVLIGRLPGCSWLEWFPVPARPVKWTLTYHPGKPDKA